MEQGLWRENCQRRRACKKQLLASKSWNFVTSQGQNMMAVWQKNQKESQNFVRNADNHQC
eukprot:472492-Hanusia_phi.AAC.14